MIAWISPARTVIETPFSASTAPKRRPRPFASSTVSRDVAGARITCPEPASGEGDFETALARDQQFLDLRRAVADGADAVVAVVTRHRAVIHEAPAAMHLDRLVGAFGAGFGREILRHRQLFEVVAALVDAPGGSISDEPRAVDLERHVGDHFLDELQP